jgi:tetratricopeptide (TPR) repeat protein
LTLEQLDEAVASCRRALQLKPQYAEAHNNLGVALRGLGQLDEAVASCRRALQIKPQYAEAHNNLGIALKLSSLTSEAEASCRRALAIDPNSASAFTTLAGLRADQGQFAEAEELFKHAISIDPDSPEAWSGIARLRKMTDGDAGWLAAVQRIAEHRLPPQKEVNLRYAIAKYFDDVKDFEQAFVQYQRANELSKLYRPGYDRERLTRIVDLIVNSYDRQWLSRMRFDASGSARPVFIVGMPRSGTTLAEQILASHPAVFGAGELGFWSAASATYESSTRSGEMSASVLGGLATDYLRLLAGLSADALRVVDKMPANFLHLGLIHAALPKARIIHLRRNPIDTCLSIYFQHFNAVHSYANDLEDLAHYFTEYWRVMEHWRSILPEGVMLDLPYEGLVDGQEAWSRKMLEFIGLPWDPQCMDFHQTHRTVVTASNWQVRQKITQSSVARWRNYEKFVEPLLHLMKL